jgi:uroporphyrinogen decarboxylase
MDCEERLYRALGGEKTDRIPTLSPFADPNIINQALGTKPLPVLRYLASEHGGNFVDRHHAGINRFFKPGMYFFANAAVKANLKMGFDGTWMGYWRLGLRSSRDLEEAFGRLFDIVDDGYGNPYMMYSDGLINGPDEWRAYPRPSIAEYAQSSMNLFRFLRRAYRGKIAIVAFIGPGVWENSWQPMGFARFVALMRRDSEFAREVIDYFTTLSVATVDACGKAGARVMGFGEDLAYKSGPMVSPAMLDDFFADSYRQITTTAHRHGARIYIHCCGNSYELLDRFVDWGFDGAHAFEPTAGNDLAAAREKVGDRLCLVGNIDISHVLIDGTREEVEAAVEKAVKDSRGGGFILAPTHSTGDIRLENVRWMLDAARRLS